jgi:hypothetical protein
LPKPSKKVVAQQKPKTPIWLWGLIAAGVAIIAFVVIQAASSNSTPPPVPLVTGGPALQVDKEKVDFGDVTLGQTVEAKFEVTNVGDQPLRFTKKPYVEVIEGC